MLLLLLRLGLGAKHLFQYRALSGLAVGTNLVSVRASSQQIRASLALAGHMPRFEVDNVRRAVRRGLCSLVAVPGTPGGADPAEMTTFVLALFV